MKTQRTLAFGGCTPQRHCPKIAQHRTVPHRGKRLIVGKIEPHLKFCPLCLRHAVVVFNQCITTDFAELGRGVTR